MLAEFPVRRPIVSMVIAILIVIMGVVAYPTLPVAQGCICCSNRVTARAVLPSMPHCPTLRV